MHVGANDSCVRKGKVFRQNQTSAAEQGGDIPRINKVALGGIAVVSRMLPQHRRPGSSALIVWP